MVDNPQFHDPMDEHEDDDFSVNPSEEKTIGDVMAARMGRRSFLKGMTFGAAVAAGSTMTSQAALAMATPKASMTFKELPLGYDEMHHVADGYDSQVLLRWGDAVKKDAPTFDPMNQTTEAQLKQFGYNCDFVGYLPLPHGSENSDHGLLCINHEYTNRHLMFNGVGKKDLDKQTKEQIDIEMAAHGHTVVEIKKMNGQWSVIEDSEYAQRINALNTEMELTGPVAGHDRVKTSADPMGKTVIGTINNCAGGVTPWGTVLIAEENFHGYFGGDPAKTAEGENYKRYGMKGKSRYGWSRFHDRFDVEKEANEPNRFGWMVEIDPYEPHAKPKKRTALGRFKHEGANALINKDRHVVVYTGDDQRFEYLYKFVSKNKYNYANQMANKDILDDGTLYVAQFRADGNLFWLPLVHGTGPLTAENGFNSQADVLIETRKAADLLGATPMDRPEDVEPNMVTGSVFMMLTNNTKRKSGQEDAANPRAANKHGHIIEMTPPGGRGSDADHAADVFKWNIFLMAGNHAKKEDAAMYGDGVSKDGWLSCPDNVAFDNKGRVWIATDGAPKSGIADGLWVADADGPARAQTRHFFSAPLGAELCGPCFTPDDSTLFVAIQHPADTKGSTFAKPSTRWPDFDDKMPPRPSVVAITKRRGGPIG
ncbi:PhoX family phosphatase [Terasakiella sp. A23]|uniref:PhoX family protein n=1 Tax=Terasakiella sp. FCG-A23 TaxID=3080561 RepID=UPI0029540F0F|nr:PhoX family phosphatase [Terasakiella sp. A23]MDV7339824.1 PhoX family phosphatase [Terasakiella sp. A23]